MLVFVGHALDVNDQPYLVPIEGEFGTAGIADSAPVGL